MPMQFSSDFPDVMATEFVTTANGLLGASGKIEIFDGTMPPDTTSADAGTLLVTLTLSSTAFGSASGPTFSALSITPGSAVASGTMQYFRFKDSGGFCVMQGVCGDTGIGENITFNTATVNTSDTVSISAFDCFVFVGG